MKNLECRMQNFFRSAYSTIVAPATKNVSSFCIFHSAFLNRRQTNSGVALIMVLGLLTVMIILAVTFAISMRTERLAAGNYADTVRARELVQVGLARAMNDLAVNLGPTGLYQPDGKVYPIWNVTNSYYTNTTAARWSTNIYLIKGEATNYVPRVLWTAVTNADTSNPSYHWLPVESLIYDNGSLVESNLMGRVAYMIINCSGLLDANYAGGATRLYGTNPNEIVLGETNSNFKNDRETTHVRYETMGELNALADIKKPATNLFVYSRAPSGYWNTNASCMGTQMNLSGSAAELILRQNEITSAFTNAGFSVYESGVLYSNLIDYVDGDFVPSNFEYCVENVPMINEVVVSNGIDVSAGIVDPAANRIYKVFTDVYIECWYPFVKSAGVSFNLNVTNKFSGTGGVQPPDISDNTPINPTAGSPPVKYRCHSEATLTERATVPSITLTTKIYPKVQLGVNVDELKNPIELATTHDGNALTRDNQAASFECLDPRFNYDPADPLHWRTCTPAVSPSDASVPDVNPWVTGWWPTNQYGDTNSEMYLANTNLRSVAELGYLVYSQYQPWKTVNLNDPRMKHVVDYFAVGTNDADVYVTQAQDARRGLVNPNSMQVDALAAVFADMPIGEYPGDSSLGQLNMGSAKVVAENIYASRFYTNLSEVVRAFENISQLTNTGGGVITFDNKLKRESLFRNSINLLNLRQNMFAIIIEAQAASGGNIPRNPARQRAVAIVWRDPYTGEMFVRHIKWLGD